MSSPHQDLSKEFHPDCERPLRTSRISPYLSRKASIRLLNKTTMKFFRLWDPKVTLLMVLLAAMFVAISWRCGAGTTRTALTRRISDEHSRLENISYSNEGLDNLLTLALRKPMATNDDDKANLKEQVLPLFELWVEQHGKVYKVREEWELRLETFVMNAQTVAFHNDAYAKGWTTYAQTIMNSPFSDMTAEEFSATHLMESQNCSATHVPTSATTPLINYFDLPKELPPFVDWRTKGILTPVKNQKHCGSCWTFSTSGTLEAHTCLHSANDWGLDCTTWDGLAEQQLLDCAWDYDNHGCNGGLPSHAFEYLKHTNGMYDEDSYPYRAEDSPTCQETSISSAVIAPVAAVYNVTTRMEDDLVSAVAHIGPVAVAYQVAPDFRFYSHGVYDSFNATSNTTVCKDDNMSVNHAVVAVGFGTTDDGVPYYIIRNSWSKTWGM